MVNNKKLVEKIWCIDGVKWFIVFWVVALSIKAVVLLFGG
jgi:hypothetical protein